MTNPSFDDFLLGRLRTIQASLDAQAQEYASTADRLAHFKRAAAILQGTPAQACVGFLTKHLVSVLDLVEDQARGETSRLGRVAEKIGASINYLILLEALLCERTAPERPLTVWPSDPPPSV